MKTIGFIFVVILALAALVNAQTTEFTYQGNLKDGVNAANGNYDFEFALFDALSAGTQLGTTLQRNAVAVSNGVFSVKLDFGAQFPGANRFLEIRVRLAGQPAFTTLSPRQPVSSSPYSVKSLTADSAISAATAANSQQLGGIAANQYVLTGDPRLSDARNPLPGSGNYIQNQNVGPQASSNFNISGTGLASIFNAVTQFNIGGNRILSNSGASNIIAGVGAGAANTGCCQAFFGANAGLSNTTGAGNSFFGEGAGNLNTVGGSNAFFGRSAGFANTTGSNNAFFGAGSGFLNSTGINNAFFGLNAGNSNTSGSGNAFFGQNAGFTNTTGSNNTLIGLNSNVSSPSLSYATAIGADAVVGTNNTIVIGRSGGQETVQIPGNINVAGNITGRGALPWQTVSGSSVQAQPNNGYLITGDAQTTVTLLTAPNIGDIVRVSGTGSGGWKIAQNAGQSVIWFNPQIGSTWTQKASGPWQAVASSADVTKLVALVFQGQIYTSTDFGVTMTPRESNRNWRAAASSADGTKLVAAANTGQIYTSTDSGVIWTPRESSRGWQGVASSADGAKLVAVATSAQIYTSTDSGVSWTPRESSRGWQGVASSADGTNLVAIAFGGQIYTSTDSGVSWTPRDTNRNWRAVASSADGTTLIAAEGPGKIYTSVDSGVTWTPRESVRNWTAVAVSADGSKLFASTSIGLQGVDTSDIYISADGGVSWTRREFLGVGGLKSIATSADGRKSVAVGDYLYTSDGASTISTTVGTGGVLKGGQFSAIELQYIGSGKFMAISREGPVIPY